MRRSISTGIVAASVVALGLVLAATPARAVVISSGTTSVDIVGTNVASWTIGGTQQVGFGIQYFYRIGDAGPELPLNSLTVVNYGPGIDNPLVGTDDYLIDLVDDAGNPSFQVTVKYGTIGGGGLTSILPVEISVTALQGAMDFHLFEYSDLDLAGTMDDDLVTIVGDNSVTQSDGLVTFEGNSVLSGPNPSMAHDVALFPVLLNALTDGLPTNLAGASVLGPGDLEFAFQWNLALDANDPLAESQIVSINKQITLREPATSVIPEPATTALSIMGLMALGGTVMGRRRRA